ncbi:NADH:ubiquinone dehydrogenase [Operophtera brumata]|uniref:NADH dehydrogenase [ubiquinone] 1 alpha subcomplex subunit 12 n=1 Tax=Operophtera brumata TaxID=104452 RepID=A0A0L7KT39_OPEBR|nr:NADH:ubiquinone dehydrogenase [Operophtera brumata]
MSLAKYLALDKVVNFFSIVRQNGGIRGCLYKLYRQDEIKDGVLVGEDKYGNKYFENPRYFYSRNRWIEYNEKYHMQYDGSQDPSRPKYKWMLDSTENMSGTTGQYTPYSTTRAKVEAWMPPKTS